jgi:hypothetical protein
VADTFNFTIRKITPTGTNWMVSTIAGLGRVAGTNNGAGSDARFGLAGALRIDSATNLYVVDNWFDPVQGAYLNTNTIRKIDLLGTNWAVKTISDPLPTIGSGITTDGAGNVYAGVYKYNPVASWILRFSPSATNWVPSTFAGGQYGFADGTGTNAQFSLYLGLTADGAGNLYVADAGNNEIRKVTSAGVVRTLAGLAANSGSSDGTGNAAQFYLPMGLAVDSAGNIYVADTGNNTIRTITSGGVVSTLAGLAGSAGYNNGAGNYARFFGPAGLAVDGGGNLYVAEGGNSTIRMITPAGVVSAIAGVPQTFGNKDGPGDEAMFWGPLTVALNSAGELFVADPGNNTIRKIIPTATNWFVTTIAGDGQPGSNDGTNRGARFSYPTGIVLDGAGDAYVADNGNGAIRKLTLVDTNWVVSTVAVSAAVLDGNWFGLGVDILGNLYATYGSTILMLASTATGWVASTIGGLDGVLGGTDGAGSAARFYNPTAVAVDSAGTVYVADTENSTIRKGVFTAYITANPVPYPQPSMDAQLIVTLVPTNGQWRFPWELGWRDSDQAATNLVAGNYTIEFRSLPGYLAPSQPVTVSGLTHVTNQYLPTLDDPSSSGRGALTVNMGLNPPSGAAWRFLGESDSNWRAPGSTVSGLLPGVYFIEFKPVDQYSKPANRAVQVDAGVTIGISDNYVFAQQAPGGVLLPIEVPAAQLTNLNSYPFGFNGQLLSDQGYGSGVAVLDHVVLTAAHLVFEDETLSYVSRAHWFFQQETGIFSPLPQGARAFFVLSGYAAQRAFDRANGIAPGQSTPQSRNLDVAALWFESSVAGGGWGGYLDSDTVPNQWLTGNALKMLVGYPVDASVFGTTITPGKIYQTDPQPYSLSLATDPVSDQQVYVAPWFLSYPGNSGGPFYVQYNGYYYPAGVYLGTLYNGAQPYASLVRAIDTNVVRLITLAAAIGDFGTNNDGGVIRFLPDKNISGSNPGEIQFDIEPPEAYAAGARWRLHGDAGYSTLPNYTRMVTTTNLIVVEFVTNVPGWLPPPSQAVPVHPQQTTRPSAFYTVTNPVLIVNASLQNASLYLGITGTTGTTYRIERSTSLMDDAWSSVSTNTIHSNGFNPVPLPPFPGQPAAFYRARWLP